MDDNCKCKIGGIVCHADSCVYHTKDNCCEAGKIQVSSCCCSGTGKNEPACDTYKSKM